MLLPSHSKRSKKRIILFLDTGDNCRCPLAKGYLTKLLEERGIRHIEVKTAGVMTPTGLLPQPEVVQLLKEEGVDISHHRSHPVTVQMIEDADLILGMSSFHVQTAIRRSPAARGKAFLLKEYVGYSGKAIQIGDPMGGTMEIFKKCFEQIKDALEKLVEMDIIRKPPEDWTEPPARAPREGEPLEAEAVGAGGDGNVGSTTTAKKEMAAAGATEAGTKPRRRGRPPKSAEKSVEVAQSAEPKRKRGRPPKSAKAGEAQAPPKAPKPGKATATGTEHRRASAPKAKKSVAGRSRRVAGKGSAKAKSAPKVREKSTPKKQKTGEKTSTRTPQRSKKASAKTATKKSK
ncbi:MAG: hypothetical protein N2644_01470 [Candidatus Sumerlaea chitinivorans]|nr:hypothetical protein [Candidatus Sumerlaea chitinivorans]